jgi:hypothetical protein
VGRGVHTITVPLLHASIDSLSSRESARSGEVRSTARRREGSLKVRVGCRAGCDARRRHDTDKGCKEECLGVHCDFLFCFRRIDVFGAKSRILNSNRRLYTPLS